MSDEFFFDERAATVAEKFFEVVLRHVDGDVAGHSFKLERWQRNIVRDIFGWKRRDGSRKFRTVYIEVPRKNGKSTLSAGIALILLFADDEPGAQVFSAAADRDQAAIVFQTARAMVEDSPALNRMAEIFKRSIVVSSTRSVYRVLSADAFTKHGLNAHGIIFDELHAQPNRELWDVLTTSTGARRQPMVVGITTAGYDRNSICWEIHEYARQVKAGAIVDETFYGAIFAADEDDDWTAPSTWAKANPNLGVSIRLDYLQTECEKAKNMPAYQNTFRRLHLNQWTSQETRWLDMRLWDACGTAFDPESLSGRRCYAGLDLASTTDIAALALVFPPETEDEPFHVVVEMFVPEEGLVDRGRRDRVPYEAWVRDGWLTATPGNVIDYDVIRRTLNELAEVYQIEEVAFDRWGATLISQQLTDDGFTMVQFGQGFASMSAPTKELLNLVLAGKVRHGGHPVLRWMADNLVVDQDAAGNVKPNKAKSRTKIDGIVATIMGLARATAHQEHGSVYDDRGVLTL